MARFDDVLRGDVLRAIAEHDRLGEDACHARYGFGRARTYRIVYEGRQYASKAVLGAAAGLAASEFSGGEGPTAPVLRRLGFDVSPGSPPKCEAAGSLGAFSRGSGVRRSKRASGLGRRPRPPREIKRLQRENADPTASSAVSSGQVVTPPGHRLREARHHPSRRRRPLSLHHVDPHAEDMPSQVSAWRRRCQRQTRRPSPLW